MVSTRAKRIKRNRRNRSVRPRATGKVNVLSTTGPATQRVFRIPRGKTSFPFANQNRVISKLSEAGLAFLKCAFASPDFSVDPGKGIPDQFHGRTLSIKDCFTTALSFTPGFDTYIVQAPVPGFAYFKAEVPIGTNPVKFTGVPFPSFVTNFGTGSDTDNKFSKFRYASLASGIYPTSNFMQFAGSIQVWRVDLNLAEVLTHVSGTFPDNSRVGKRIQGLQGIVSLAPRDNYSDSFIKGAYTYAFDKTQDFEWCDFCSGDSYDEIGTAVPVAPTTRQLLAPGPPVTTQLTGLGNTNSIVYKISTPLLAVNTAVCRFWNCIELQPDTNSSLFQFSGVSPPHDPLAIELYSQLKMRFPVAVPCSENSKFWETVLRAISQVSKIGMLLPGPFGVISGGVNTVAEAIHGLM